MNSLGGVYVPSHKSINRKSSETQLQGKTFNLLEKLGGLFLPHGTRTFLPKILKNCVSCRLGNHWLDTPNIYTVK